MAEEQTIGTARVDIVVNSDGVEVATNKAKNSINSMSREAQAEYQKMTAAQKRQVDGLLRNADQLGMTRSEQLAYNATLKTSGALHEEVTKRIRAHEAAQASDSAALDMGYRSHKQLQQAMRGTPAQISDIVVSLQGGQRPMTVFLQQGLQLRDMFGSWKQVAAGAGSAVVGMINPITLAASAAGALFAAWHMGQKEAQVFNKAIVMSGNVAGLSAGELQTMARQVGEVTGTQREASGVLAQMAGSANIAKEGMAGYAETAISLNRLVGISVEETIGDFESLGKTPVEASQKLNEQYGYLTFAVYEQIKALEEQGRTDEAAELAQQTYKNAMDERATAIEAKLGTLEKAWSGVGGAASKAWDFMLNIGREASLEDQIKSQIKTIENLQKVYDGYNYKDKGPAQNALAGLEAAKATLATLEQTKQGQDAVNASTAEGNRLQQEMIAADAVWGAAAPENQKKKNKLQTEENELRRAGIALGKTQEEIETQVAALRAKSQPKTNGGGRSAGDAELASIRARIAAQDELLERLKIHGTETQKLTEGERIVLKLQEDLTGKLTARQRATKELALEEAKRLVTAEKATQAEEDRLKREQAFTKEIDESRKARQKQVEEMLKTVEQMDKSNTTLREEIELIGKSRQEQAKILIGREEQRLAVEELRLAEMRRAADANEHYSQELYFQEELVSQIRERIALLENKDFAEGNAEAAKLIASQWDKTAETIGDTLADYIMGGGKDAAQYLKRLFATLVLQPVVNYGVQGVMGALGMGPGSAGSGVAGGIPSPSSIMGLGNSSMYTNFATGSFGQTLGLSSVESAAGPTMPTMTGLGQGVGTALSVIGWAAAAYSLYNLIKGLDGSGDPHRGAVGHYQTGNGSENYAAGVTDYDGEIGLGLQNLAQGIGTSFESFLESFGQSARIDVAANWADDFDGEGESWGGFVLQMQDAMGEWKTLVDWSADGVGRFGQARDFGPGEEGYAEFITAVSQSYVEALKQVDLPEWASGMLDGIASDASLDTIVATLNQLGLMRETLAHWNTYLVEFANVGDAAFGALLESMGGFENLSTGVASFVDLFYSDAEKLEMSQKQIAEQLAKFDLKMPMLDMSDETMDTAEEVKAAWRSMVEEALAAGEEGADLAAMLLNLGPAFASATDAAESAAQAEAELAQAREDARQAQLDEWMSLGGLSVQSMSQGVMDALQNGEDPGAWLADHITGGFEQAMQMQALNMVMQRIMDEALAPAMEEIMTDLFGEKSDSTATTAEEAVLKVFDAMDAAFAAVTGESVLNLGAGQVSTGQVEGMQEISNDGLASLDTTMPEGTAFGSAFESVLVQMKPALEAFVNDLGLAGVEAVEGADLTPTTDAISQLLGGIVSEDSIAALAEMFASLPEMDPEQAAAAAAMTQESLDSLLGGIVEGSLGLLDASMFASTAFDGMADAITAGSSEMLNATATASVVSTSAVVGHANSSIKTIDEAVSFANGKINELLSSELGQQLFGGIKAPSSNVLQPFRSVRGDYSSMFKTQANDMISAWKSVYDAIYGSMTNLRDAILGATEDEGSSFYEAQFAMLTAQARAGDQEAAEKLPELVAKLTDYAKGNSASLFDQNASIAGYIKSLEETQGYIAGLYQKAGGKLSDLEAWDTQSVHQAVSVSPVTVPQKVIPAVDNSALLNSLNSSSGNQALIAEVRALNAKLDAANARLAAIERHAENNESNTRNTSRTLDEVTNGGEGMFLAKESKVTA